MSSSPLTEAVDLFVMTKFDQCFNECNNLIKGAKCEPEQERNHKLIEAATALGIQALAETDTWYCVVAFILDVYGAVDLCPPSIIQLCILLHAQVKEYLPCHKAVEMWLKNPHNQKHKQYSQVVRTYAYHILFPTGSYGLIKEIAENSVSLTQDERAALLQLSQKRRSEESRISGNETNCLTVPNTLARNVSGSVCESTQLRFIQGTNGRSLSNMEEQDAVSGDISNNNTPTDSGSRACQERSNDLSKVQAVLKWLYEIIVVKFNYFRHPRFSLFLLGVLVIWALIQTQSGDTVSSLGRFIILWRMFLQKLRVPSSSK